MIEAGKIYKWYPSAKNHPWYGHKVKVLGCIHTEPWLNYCEIEIVNAPKVNRSTAYQFFAELRGLQEADNETKE